MKRLTRDKHFSLFDLFVSDEEKSFMTLTTCFNVIYLLNSSLMLSVNKLVRLSLASPFRLVLYLRVRLELTCSAYFGVSLCD